MSEPIKRVIAVAGVLVAGFCVVYGSYLPYRKSALFISALRTANQATTLDEFLVPYMIAFDATSPIGQTEVVRNFANTVAGVASNVGKSGGQVNTQLIRALGATFDRYALPTIERRSGLSQAQSFYAYASAYTNLDDVDDTRQFRVRAKTLMDRAYELSPDRPQTLYPLLDYAQRYGNEKDELKYAERIVALWPSDTKVQKILNTIKNGQ